MDPISDTTTSDTTTSDTTTSDITTLDATDITLPVAETTARAYQKPDQVLLEVLRDEIDYWSASNTARIAHQIIEMEFRRAKKHKRQPFQGSPPDDDLDHHQHRIEDCEREMARIRAKHAGRPRVSLNILLVDLGAGLLAARQAAGLTPASLADRLAVPIAQVEQWETCCYADLPLSRLPALLKAMGLNPSASVLLSNAVPELRDARRPGSSHQK